MGLFGGRENRIRCGKCNTEFDLNVNKNRCPLCGFGRKTNSEESDESITTHHDIIVSGKGDEYVGIPPLLNLKSGKVIVNDETKIWGSWLMFNDFFAPKFLCRVLAWKMHKEKKDYLVLNDLMKDVTDLIKKNNLSELKGFPNLKKDPEGTRLVQHFLRTFTNMGLIKVELTESNADDIWTHDWKNIKVCLTKKGLEFARLRNQVFDEGMKNQIMTREEKTWLISYLKEIDKEDYREYSTLKEVYLFLKAGRNGNKDLWTWFEKNKKYCDYIEKRSARARKNPKILEKQIYNYARTFSSAKVSLLRELGVVKDKRGDYTIIGEI